MGYKPNPVCLKCCEEMQCIKNGVSVVWGYFVHEDDKPRGQKSAGDIYECQNCGARFVTCFGKSLEVFHHPIRDDETVVSIDGSFPPQNIPE